jgi:hypothetical protein
MSELTPVAKDLLRRAARAELSGEPWIRAARNGERPSLAALSRKGLLERREREGRLYRNPADKAYEYRLAEVLRNELRRKRGMVVES